MSEPTLEVVVERLKGLTTLINTKFDDNKRQHDEITKRQDTANHRTTKLEKWKEEHTHDMEKELSSKYASKRIEKIVDSGMWLIITGVIITGLTLILK